MSDGFDELIGQHTVGTMSSLDNRREDRDTNVFVSKCDDRGGKEHDVACSIAAAYNNYGLGTVMSVEKLSPEGLIVEYTKDEGDSKWTFVNLGNWFFSVVVEIKLRDGRGNVFRPRLMDIEKCLKYHRPYVLVMNYNTGKERVHLLLGGDLVHIRDNYEFIHQEPDGRKIYGGKPYAKVDSSNYPYVWLSDLSFSNSIDLFGKWVDTLRQVSELQKSNAKISV